jgi:hypothetical protein
MSISTSLLEIFHLTWEMFEEAIEKIPMEHWRTGDDEYLIPSRLVYHVLDSSDYYSSIKPEEYERGYRFKLNWKEAAPEELPNREQTQSYLTEVREKITNWVTGMNNTEVLSTNDKFPWTGSTTLSILLYILSHCRQHFGEINAELRRRGLPRIKWRTYRK